MDYKNAGGKRIQTEVMPLGLAQQGGPRLYLVCRFPGSTTSPPACTGYRYLKCWSSADSRSGWSMRVR
ncbi:hypothetical protein RA876_18335 [Rhodoferax antarcticus]|nr:hypothetical protein RA876_18335 [Rhodoferax antarcticus]